MRSTAGVLMKETSRRLGFVEMSWMGRKKKRGQLGKRGLWGESIEWPGDSHGLASEEFPAAPASQAPPAHPGTPKPLHGWPPALVRRAARLLRRPRAGPGPRGNVRHLQKRARAAPGARSLKCPAALLALPTPRAPGHGRFEPGIGRGRGWPGGAPAGTLALPLAEVAGGLLRKRA